MNIEQGNKEFLNKLEKDEALRNKRDELVKGQHPETLVITCSDSRVIPELIFNSSLGDLFVIRTAGNVINEGELATVEYAIEHLKVKHIIVLGHTHCGAIHAAINNEKGKYLDPILNRIRRNICDVPNELMATTMNAIAEKDYLKEKFPQYEGTIEYKIYDIENSVVF